VHVTRITDLDHEALADYNRLTDVALRRRMEPAGGLWMAESTQVVRRSLAAGHRPRSLLLAPRWLQDGAAVVSDVLAAGADVLVAEEGEAGSELVLDALATGGPDAVRALAIEPPPAPLAAERSWIDDAYRGDDAVRVLGRLRGFAREGLDAAGRAADDLEAASPTSVVLTLAAQRRARDLPDLEAVLGQELGLVTALADSPDLVEGIRARVVDKDRSPRWSPARLADVDAAAVLARVDWDTRI